MSNIHLEMDPDDPMAYCAECLKEVLKSEAYDPEGMDYATTFCGFECYEAWNRKLDRDRKEGGSEKK